MYKSAPEIEGAQNFYLDKFDKNREMCIAVK